MRSLSNAGETANMRSSSVSNGCSGCKAPTRLSALGRRRRRIRENVLVLLRLTNVLESSLCLRKSP